MFMRKPKNYLDEFCAGHDAPPDATWPWPVPSPEARAWHVGKHLKWANTLEAGCPFYEGTELFRLWHEGVQEAKNDRIGPRRPLAPFEPYPPKRSIIEREVIAFGRNYAQRFLDEDLRSTSYRVSKVTVKGECVQLDVTGWVCPSPRGWAGCYERLHYKALWLNTGSILVKHVEQ